MLNWPNVLTGVGTTIMAIGVIITAIFAFKNWNKSLKKDKQDIVGKLFAEFSNNSQISTGMQLLSGPQISNNTYETNAEEIISFFAKLGKLLKEEIISIEDIKIYFYNYILYEKKMLNIIGNLKFLVPEIPIYYYEDFSYLMNRISDSYNIKSYKNIVDGNFALSGTLSFSGSLSIKKISVDENYKILSAELRDKLDGKYDPVENVRKEESINQIIDKYYGNIEKLQIGSKVQIFYIIKKSLDEKKNHGKISEWTLLCRGIFKILENDITSKEDSLAIADIIVRISRWYKSSGNMWIGFSPYIKEIVKIIWGDIEDLYSIYTE